MSVLATIFNPRAEATTTLSRPAQWLIDVLVGEQSSSGERVNATSALGIPAWFAGIRNISEDIAKLPRGVYESIVGGGRQAMREDHRWRLIAHAPNEEMSAMEFHETIQSHALGWRGGFAEIVRRGNGVVEGMYPLDPTTVTPVRMDVTKELRYRVRTPNMVEVFLRPEQTLHIHGLGFDGITGYCLTVLLRNSLGSAMAVRNFGSSYFGNGAQPSGALEVPAGFTPEAMENLRKSFAERHEGSKNKGRTLILEADVKYKEISHEAQKAQMIEALEFGVEDVCRILRCPPHKVGHYKRAQGWSTLEMTNTEYVTDTLMPWLVRWEQEYNRKLFGTRETNLYVKHIVNGLMRGDAAARSAFYQSGLSHSYLSANDIRELEDMNPIEGGDTFYVQGALMPVDLLREKMEAEIESEKKAAEEPETPPVAPKSKDSRLETVLTIARAHEPLLADKIDVLLKREAAKVKSAEKKGALDRIGPDFYTDHEHHVISAISPVLEAFAVSCGVQIDCFACAKSMAREHVETSIGQIGTVAQPKWETGFRAGVQAQSWMEDMIALAVDRTKNDLETLSN